MHIISVRQYIYLGNQKETKIENDIIIPVMTNEEVTKSICELISWRDELIMSVIYDGPKHAFIITQILITDQRKTLDRSFRVRS